MLTPSCHSIPAGLWILSTGAWSVPAESPYLEGILAMDCQARDAMLIHLRARDFQASCCTFPHLERWRERKAGGWHNAGPGWEYILSGVTPTVPLSRLAGLMLFDLFACDLADTSPVCKNTHQQLNYLWRLFTWNLKSFIQRFVKGWQAWACWWGLRDCFPNSRKEMDDQCGVEV